MDYFQCNHKKIIGNILGISPTSAELLSKLFGINISTKTDEYFITRTDDNHHAVN